MELRVIGNWPKSGWCRLSVAITWCCKNALWPIDKVLPFQSSSNQSTDAVTDSDFWQEEEALLSEMDVTGQAFEDMQEQNSRLLQQLREKDDANFKLMSERIKSNQIYKLLKEEKEELADQVLTFKTQVAHHLQAAMNSIHCVEILSV